MKTLNDSLDLFYKGLTDQKFGAIDETASPAFQLTQTINPFGERETAITNVDARVKKIASKLGTGNNVDGEFDGSYGPGTSPIANIVVGFFKAIQKKEMKDMLKLNLLQIGFTVKQRYFTLEDLHQIF